HVLVAGVFQVLRMSDRGGEQSVGQRRKLKRAAVDQVPRDRMHVSQAIAVAEKSVHRVSHGESFPKSGQQPANEQVYIEANRNVMSSSRGGSDRGDSTPADDVAGARGGSTARCRPVCQNNRSPVMCPNR